MELRPYQERVITELLSWFQDNSSGNPIVSACVGAGKSIMIAELCRHAVTAYSEYRSRILMLVPSKELLEQNYEKLVLMAPDLKIGIVSASVGRKDVPWDKDVIVATVGSVRRNPGNLGRLDLIMVDECHLVNRKDTGMYRELINDCRRYNDALRVIGWTGTPYRGNGIWLTCGEERLFTDIASRVGIKELLSLGFLSPLIPATTGTHVSGDGIKTSNGDYVVSELAKRLDNEFLTTTISQEIVSIGADRNRWLVFCVTVEHANHMSAALKLLGVSCDVISNETSKRDRERLIYQFKTGRLRCLVNVACLTTGFDVPDIDLIALVRNTQSPVLYTQIAGRGMRIADGKDNCLWLDFTDTTERLGPIDQIRGRSEPEKRDNEQSSAPFKICDSCGAENPAGVSKCKACDEPFPEPEIKIKGRSSGAAILSGVDQYGLATLTVNNVTYRKQLSKSGHQMLRVTYFSGMRVACSEFICLEHDGFARTKAENWWKNRYDGRLPIPVPKTVDDAMPFVDDLKVPFEIIVRVNENGYSEMVSPRFVGFVE